MAKPTILVVDDDPQVLRSLARDLRRQYGRDYRIVRADGGEAALEALEEIERRDEPVALLLSDQRMPRLDGVAFLGRARERFPGAKRALLTAYADTDAAIGAINRSQVDYYLLKPWDPPEERLYPVLDDLLEEWRTGYRPGWEGIRVVGDRWSREGHRLRDFLSRQQVPYRFLDVETSEEARQLLARHGLLDDDGSGDGSGNGDGSAGFDPADLPLVVLPGGEALRAPTPTAVASAIGLETRAREPFYDLAIVGAGPAGLAAAVYGGSEGLATVLIERDAPGGQAGTSSRIENYLGFPAGLSGADLARRAVTQAKKFEVELLVPQRVASLEVDGPYKHLTLEDGSRLSCHVLMLSMGVDWRRLPAPGAEELTGRGVYYGAAMSEAPGCSGETVYMVGAGNSAGQAALFFAEHAERVVILVRGDDLGAKMSHYLVQRIEATENIDVRLGTEVLACHGETRLEALDLGGSALEAPERVEAHYLFVFIGAAPHTDWLRGVVALDRRGFVLTGPDLEAVETPVPWPLERAPFLLEASVPGVFAAGDVRHDSVKRVASAVGEGSVAVHFMHRHLADL